MASTYFSSMTLIGLLDSASKRNEMLGELISCQYQNTFLSTLFLCSQDKMNKHVQPICALTMSNVKCQAKKRKKQSRRQPKYFQGPVQFNSLK